MTRLLAAAASIVLFCVMATGTLVPVNDGRTVNYIFVWGGFSALATASLVTSGAVLLLGAIVRARISRVAPGNVPVFGSGRWFEPVFVLGVLVVGLAPAWPGVGERAAPLAYACVDLRWWWVAGVVVWVLARLDPLMGAPIATRLAAFKSLPEVSRLLLWDALVFIAVISCVSLTVGPAGWNPPLHGDEPRYVRYCENWYQGVGFDISAQTRVAALPIDDGPHMLRLVPALFRALGRDAASFGSDLAAFARQPMTFKWNRAVGDSGFMAGWHGGVYQRHQAGLAFVLFPAYSVDRYLLSTDPNGDGKFPADLSATYVWSVFLIGVCGVVLFRFCRRALGQEPLAAGAAVVGTLALPLGAFGFQLYPEVPAAIVMIAATSFALFHGRRARAWTSAATGVGVAFLLWMHPRFLIVSAILAIAVVLRSSSRARRGFIAGYVAVLASLCVYTYHVTGSISPTALFDASEPGVSALSVDAVPLNLLGYLFHRLWGVLPHAPILFAVLPGLVALWSESRIGALLVAALGAALAIPAAGHSLSAAGGTPGRLVAAVIPLAAWPVAVLVRRTWTSPWMRALGAVLLALSLQSAFAYNTWHMKEVGPIVDQGSASGWKLNLAFPSIRGEVWDESRSNFIVLLALVALVIATGLAAVRWLRRSGPLERQTPVRPVAITHVLGAAAIVIALGTVGTQAEGQLTREDYRLRAGTARMRAAKALVDRDACPLCFSTAQRHIDWRRFTAARVDRLALTTDIAPLEVRVQTMFETDGDHVPVGRVQIDFGDGTHSDWTGVVATATVSHRYARAGRYAVRAVVQLPDGGHRTQEWSLDVPAGG